MSEARRISRELESFAARAVVEITGSLTDGLYDDTPKDTRWAASNWVPSIGSPFIERRTGDPDRSMVPSQRSLQLNALASLRANYRLSMGPTFVTNNVPYIGKLNGGSSLQAPAAFVQGRITRTVTEVGRRLVA